MGVTIFYRGSLNDLDRVEDFEDRVLDLALELGGQARIWRSGNNENPRRMIRGVVLDLYPGQETTSLLIAPEGWIINLCEIEGAEKGQLAGPSWCCVKTQFGPVEGHAALVEMLSALKREFLPGLQVRDESGYWETRNLAILTAKFGHVQAAIDGLAEGLRRYGLSREAAEDQEILIARIERIARLVQRTLARPAEHPPVCWDDEPWSDDDTDGSESQWDASYKENRRRQERVQRTIEERLARGEDFKEAFDAAMLEETALGLPEESPPSEPPHVWAEDDESEDDEHWKESLPEALRKEDDDKDIGERRRHPLQQRAMHLMLRLHKLLGMGKGDRSNLPEWSKGCCAQIGPVPFSPPDHSHIAALLRGAGDILGGLVQALDRDDSNPASGLSIVQLKRALRGAAFALGALFPLRAEGTLDQSAFDELQKTVKQLQSDLFAELCRLRQRHIGEW